MKYYSLLTFFILISLSGSAQKIHKQYAFYPQEGGNVYFIHPQKGFESKDTGAKKDLIYDITYISTKDSATFTFTYFVKDVLQINNVEIIDNTGSVVYSTPATMFYVQPKKKYWQHRATIQIPHTLLEELYKEKSPYTLTLIGGKSIRYTMKPKTWEKQSGIVSRIFEVVKYNN